MSTAGKTLLQGPKYDLPKVLDAFERLLDALASRFGGTSVSTDRPEAQRRIAWPEPGKRVARNTWTKMKEMYDVVDEPLIHVMGGGFTVKAYLLGKTWCVKNVLTGEITTPEGHHASFLDPVPTVCIYGERMDDGSYRLVDGATMDAVMAVLDDLLRELGLDIERSTVAEAATMANGKTDLAYVTFPHGSYGAGRDWISVRCVNSDGSEFGNDHLN